MDKLQQTYQGTIYPWHCDHMGHMNVMYYVGKFDEATWHLFSTVDLSGRKMREDKKGLVAVEQHIQYKAELMAGDIITITSQILECKDKSIKFRHEMRNAESGDIAAITTLTGLYFDKVKRKATSLPDEVKAKIQSLIG